HDEQMVYSCKRPGSEPRAAIGAGLLECFAVFGRATCYFLDGIFKRREIQMRRKSLRGGCDERLVWIGRGLEYTFLYFAVALANLVLCLLRQGFQLFNVGL